MKTKNINEIIKNGQTIYGVFYNKSQYHPNGEYYNVHFINAKDGTYGNVGGQVCNLGDNVEVIMDCDDEGEYIDNIPEGINEVSLLEAYSVILEENAIDGDREGWDDILVVKDLDEAKEIAKQQLLDQGFQDNDLFVIE